MFTQACTEMVMPMTCSNESMFPPSGFDYKEFVQQCMKRYGVLPRPHWITTEYGGKVSTSLLMNSVTGSFDDPFSCHLPTRWKKWT